MARKSTTCERSSRRAQNGMASGMINNGMTVVTKIPCAYVAFISSSSTMASGAEIMRLPKPNTDIHNMNLAYCGSCFSTRSTEFGLSCGPLRLGAACSARNNLFSPRMGTRRHKIFPAMPSTASAGKRMWKLLELKSMAAPMAQPHSANTRLCTVAIFPAILALISRG